MPRKGRGGKRTGKMHGQYSNRTDLAMNAGTATHLPDNVRPYGTTTPATELPQPSGGGSAPAATAPDAEPPAPAGPMPGQLTPLTAPTERPDEGLLTGLDRPNPLSYDPDELIRALYMAYPHEDIRELLEMRGVMM